MSDLNMVLVVASLIFWALAIKFYASYNNYNSHQKQLGLVDFLFLLFIKAPRA